MADWARYMYENPDVYNMFSDGGKWSWANGRQQGAYMREDGSPLQQESAAQYAQNHYNNFGKREGRKVHERNGTNYAAKLGGGGGQSGGNSELNAELAAEQSKSILTNFETDDSKKKKSFLTPIGS